MILRLTHLQFAAFALFALAAVFSTRQSVHAFSTENLRTGSDGTSRYVDPHEQVKNFGQRQGYQPLGPNGPTVQFNQGPSPMSRPFRPRGYSPPSTLNGSND
jgi:hypothetical protein